MIPVLAATELAYQTLLPVILMAESVRKLYFIFNVLQILPPPSYFILHLHINY